MSNHPYDTPGLLPKEWMLAVMHDPSVCITTRIKVAEELLKLWPHPHQYVPPALVIRIEGLGNDFHSTIEPKVHEHALQ